MAAKWLELLKQIAPGVTHVAVIYDLTNPGSTGYLPMLDAAARSFGVQIVLSAVRNTAEIKRAIDAISLEPNSGLIPLPSPLIGAQREFIISLANLYRLPNVYAFRYFPASGGGLASYGVDNIDMYRRAGSYIDRILKGEKPADLPVQEATKFELVINLKAAKALGLDIPVSVLARTDHVIE